MREDTKHLRTTFNQSAEWYDRIRPGYPEALIDDVVALAEIPAGGRILEIGCGTGKATERFAVRGYAMVCLDIGTDLAAVAAQKFCEADNIQIVVDSFEEWKFENVPFHLVMAATAFHWVNPTVAYVKSAEVLHPNGALAVFSNTHIRQDEGFSQRVQDVYERAAPSMVGVGRGGQKKSNEPVDRGCFVEPIVLRYPWEIEYSAREYIELLGTYSDHINLPETERSDLFAGIAEMIDREFGGKILKYYEAVLRLYKKSR